MDLRSWPGAIAAISPYQFALFRILLGIYLAVHCAQLIPYAPELFSTAGVLPDSALNFTHGILPNPLEHWDSPTLATAMLVALTVLAVLFAAGIARRPIAILLWYGLACLFNRNNLISNPSLPYIGLILLLSATIPAGEPFAPGRRYKSEDWFFPAFAFWGAWFLMAAGYTFSGLEKLLNSPSWLQGRALEHVLNLPLARPGICRDLVLGLPDALLQLLTWSTLAMEILFLPLCLHAKTRLFAWTGLVSMHLGIMLMISFADLSIGMLMLHLFTFDPNWFAAARPQTGSCLVLYDGVCGLCDRSVQFLLAEDRRQRLLYAPLQGETAATIRPRHPALTEDLTSIVLVRNFGSAEEKIYVKTAAVLRILDEIGGFWRPLSWLRALPRAPRDAVYDWIARKRYQWFGQFDACRMPEPEHKALFLP